MSKGQIEIIGDTRRVKVPKKPRETVYVQLPAERLPERFDGEEENDHLQYMDAALQGVLAEVGARGDESKVIVKRIVSGNGVKREDWLFECAPSEFSVTDIQESYGAGLYRVMVHGRQEGSNYTIIHANKKISIGDPKSGPVKRDAAALVPSAGNPNDLTRAIASAISGPMTALAQTLAQMMPKATSRADAIAELAQMAQLMQTMRGPASPAVDPFIALEKAITLMNASKSAAPVLNEDGEISPNAVLLQGIGLVKEFFNAARTPNVAVEPAPALAAPQEIPRPAPATPPSLSETDAMNLMLKLQMKMFLNAAVNGSDPVSYATLIYEQAPEDLLVKLESPEWFAELLKIEPGFAPHRDWCEQVRAEVLAAIGEERAEGAKGGASLTGGADKGINSADASQPGGTTPGNAARNS